MVDCSFVPPCSLMLFSFAIPYVLLLCCFSMLFSCDNYTLSVHILIINPFVSYWYWLLVLMIAGRLRIVILSRVASDRNGLAQCRVVDEDTKHIVSKISGGHLWSEISMLWSSHQCNESTLSRWRWGYCWWYWGGGSGGGGSGGASLPSRGLGNMNVTIDPLTANLLTAGMISLTYLSTYLPTYLPTYSRTHLLTHSLTHSLIFSPSLLPTGTQLVFYTCSVSPLNVREFVKAGGVTKLYEIISYAMYIFTHPSSRNTDNNHQDPHTSSPSHTHYPSVSTSTHPSLGFSATENSRKSSLSRETAKELLIYGMKAFTAVSNFEVGGWRDLFRLLP